MIKLLTKIIWNERKINAWILCELTLIFSILLFCMDLLISSAKVYMSPVGFDISHTYNVSLDTLPQNVKSEAMDKEVAMETIMKRIKANPDIENVCVSELATPYGSSSGSSEFMVDSAKMSIHIKLVSPEYFDVFKIKFLKGRNFNSADNVNQNIVIIGTGPTSDMFDKIAVNKIDSIKGNSMYKVVGVVDKTKDSEFSRYEPVVYFPITNKNAGVMGDNVVSIRVKADADSKDFPEKFTKEMREQLEIGNYFLVNVKPVTDDKEQYFKASDNILKSTISVSLFLLVNIFLGIIGTFWLRTQSRRSEIALQMALGANKYKVRQTYILEAILLLFIASILGVIISGNILSTEVSIFEDISFLRLFIDYASTFGVLLAITVLAVWYPSQNASKVRPATVLREE